MSLTRTSSDAYFLVAIEGFVYQVVELNQRCIQIMSGKCDQKRPNSEERDQMRPNKLVYLYSSNVFFYARFAVVRHLILKEENYEKAIYTRNHRSSCVHRMSGQNSRCEFSG